MDGTRQVAQRIVNAEERFIATVMERGFTKEQAVRVLNIYRKARVLTLDAVGGTYSVKYGAFWDVAVLEGAAEVCRTAGMSHS